MLVCSLYFIDMELHISFEVMENSFLLKATSSGIIYLELHMEIIVKEEGKKNEGRKVELSFFLSSSFVSDFSS